ncbi:autotransporter outer membrane beta-barrel domain-containing protein [Stenotrophomonas sp. HMWF003]|uniref:autotransporter family protein n=1 Tax=Stenotrophomonas sp. HMWF003 TaxID=2056840 RepID=UPI000D4CE167|nr:autotransporter outer membrane beta-barrel domain-containing protein [Stenotrophomonas sp. HMWF003]PTT60454.1 autotransporter outer membrane beta-barrel domain-containing protein [Stenotrophomonas sp. HMWF003]
MKLSARHSLSLAIAVAMSLSFPVAAGNLLPGESATVAPGEVAEAWRVDRATLDMLPGAEALTIVANGGTVSMRDALLQPVSGDYRTALDLAMSFGPSPQMSTADIAGSRIIVKDGRVNTGVTMNRGSLTLRDGSLIEAGNGIQLYGGDVVMRDSTIRASNVGVEIRSPVPGTSTLSVANSLVHSKADVFTASGNTVATINVTNSTLTAADGLPYFSGYHVALAENSAQLSFTASASALHGEISARFNGALDAVLRDGTTFYGRTSALSGGTLNLAMQSGSAWTISNNSTVTNLVMDGNTSITFGPGTYFNSLTVTGDFHADDALLMFNTALGDDASKSDRLIVAGDTSGSATVRVNNVGGAGAQTEKGIELISVGGASNGQFNLAGRAVGGQYEYFLHKGTGADGNWYLRSVLPTVPDPCVIDPDLPQCTPVDPGPGPGPNPDPVLRPEPGAYLANLQAAQTMFLLGYHHRHAGQNAGRAWARVDGSRHGFGAISQQLDIHGNSQALSVGADVWRHDSGSNAGVMLSSGNADSTSTNPLTGYYARGKVKGEALGIYGTWRGGNAADPYAGFYVDGSVQRAQFRNRVDGIGLATERYDGRIWQGAVEAGYAFRVGGASNGAIFLEPQLQVGYNRWDDLHHTEATGTVISSRDADGLFGRVGLRLSGVTRWGHGAAEVQPYLAAHWLHTRADSEIRMDDERVDARIPRSRAEVSAGASLKFANGIGAWGGLARQQASGYHQTNAQLGLSYTW